jgi:Intracellular proteinase inhibitor
MYLHELQNDTRPMRKYLLFVCLFVPALCAYAQAPSNSPGDHGLLSRVLHPFGGAAKKKAPKYQDQRLRGLVLELQIPAEPVKLSEVRQLHVKAILSNVGSSPVTLDFPNSERVEIQLLDANGRILTRWSENRAFDEQPGTLLINPREQIVYDETIATRELQPGRVYTVEVFFPRYPEIRARQKFMTAQ